MANLILTKLGDSVRVNNTDGATFKIVQGKFDIVVSQRDDNNNYYSVTVKNTVGDTIFISTSNTESIGGDPIESSSFEDFIQQVNSFFHDASILTEAQIEAINDLIASGTSEDVKLNWDNTARDSNQALTLGATAFSGDYNNLFNKPTIPASQIQSDWNQSNSSSADYIKNKPSIPIVPSNATVSASGLMSSSDKTKLDGITGGATAPSSLAGSQEILL